MKKIGIIGSGIVSRALTTGFSAFGYQVKVGSGTPEKIASWPDEIGPDVSVGTFLEAAQFGEIVVLAVKGSAAKTVLSSIGEISLSNKVVIDTGNPIADAPPMDGVLRFFTGPNSSLLEELQAAFPSIHFVKAFSCIGAAHMVNPDFGGQKPSMFGCGDDPAAKDAVRKIVEDFGFEWEDMGSTTSARAIEPLCMLWCIPGFASNR